MASNNGNDFRDEDRVSFTNNWGGWLFFAAIVVSILSVMLFE